MTTVPNGYIQINLIQDPPYIVDFTQYEQPVEKVHIYAVQHIQYFLAAIEESVIYSIKNLPLSFMYTVFGYRNRWSEVTISMNLFALSFRIVCWVLKVLWGTFENTFKFFNEKFSINHSEMISNFAGEAINPHHLTCQDESIDMQEVPDRVAVRDLLKMFDEINFNEPNSPGYMHFPLSDYTSPGQLRKDLEAFIKNINGRIAFLGTPPSYDPRKLMSFYQKIEDAVRSCIYKVRSDLERFRKGNGENIRAYDESKKKKYINLLENQARLVIDFAIAGKYCGARYMGEAMDSYYLLHEDVEMKEQTLKTYLQQVLARKRKEIAMGIIEKNFEANTHGFNQYMASMGSILGIPGTKGITETLARPINIQEQLKNFFKEYTVTTIIEFVREKFGSSQSFREKIFNWAKDQIGNWKKKTYDIEGILGKVDRINQDDQLRDLSFEENIRIFIELIEALEAQKFESSNNDWEMFIEDLLCKESVKSIFRENLPPFELNENLQMSKSMQEQIYFSKKKQEFLSYLKQESLGGELIEQFREWIQKKENRVRNEMIEQRSRELKKVQDLQKELFNLEVELNDEDLIKKIFSNKEAARTILKGVELRQNQSEFLHLLFLQDDNENIKVTQEFMEWLLVSQGILTPQRNQEG